MSDIRDFHYLQSLVKQELATELQKHVQEQQLQVKELKYTKAKEHTQFASMTSLGAVSKSTFNLYDQIRNELSKDILKNQTSFISAVNQSQVLPENRNHQIALSRGSGSDSKMGKGSRHNFAYQKNSINPSSFNYDVTGPANRSFSFSPQKLLSQNLIANKSNNL